MVCALLAAGLSGCGGAPAQVQPREQNSASGPKSPASELSPSESREEEAQGESAALEQNSEPNSSSSSGAYQSTSQDRIRRLLEMQAQQNSASSSSGSSEASSSSSGSSEASSSSSSSSGAYQSTSQDRIRRLLEMQAQQNSASSSSGSSEAPSSTSSNESSKTPSTSSSSGGSSKPEEEIRVLSSVEGIARLAGLQAEVETSRSACFVDVDDGENPYDVTWDYGELYDAYIQEVDWDLLFDADYYISTFPVLAHLYHKDKALLLQHFQTVGIHEGRQGCKSFNVAAYQKNCDAEVRKAFEDNYECYYLYYAMNYQTQKSVTTSGGKEKKQLTMKLTNMQQTELDNINKYRAEVGAAPVQFDPELSALACYRAYIDALEDWDAHDWVQAPENLEECYRLMDLINATSGWSENTVHGYPSSKQSALKQCTSGAWYINYRYSESHYNAMVSKQYRYLGSANVYVGVYEKENPEHPKAAAVYVQFDVFIDKLTTPMNR